MNKFYKYQLPEKPFHISVGAVLFNDDHKICLHHFYKKDIPEHLHFLADHMDEYYHLMRESLEGNEPLHDAVLRGIEEEFSAKGVVESYLGSKIDEILQPDGMTFEKLTIYHAVRSQELGTRVATDVESKTKLEWLSPEEALQIFDKQCQSTKRPELDERIIINRFISTYKVQ